MKNGAFFRSKFVCSPRLSHELFFSLNSFRFFSRFLQIYSDVFQYFQFFLYSCCIAVKVRRKVLEKSRKFQRNRKRFRERGRKNLKSYFELMWKMFFMLGFWIFYHFLYWIQSEISSLSLHSIRIFHRNSGQLHYCSMEDYTAWNAFKILRKHSLLL